MLNLFYQVAIDNLSPLGDTMFEYYERDESAHYAQDDWYAEGCDDCNFIKCVCEKLSESAIAEDIAFESALFANA
jgi:hypothetical protein